MGERVPATVIVACWNALDYTRACLDSLSPALRPGWEVVLIDNGSSDGTLAHLKRWSSRRSRSCRIVRNPRNLGYAAAMNAGARLGRAPLLVFLNNDVLLGRDCLARLSDAWGRLPQAGGLAPTTGHWKLGRARFLAAPAAALKRLQAFAALVSRYFGPNVAETDYFLPGSCFMTSRALFRRMKGFDERFFPGGYEDIDLQLRLTNASRRLGWAMGAYAHHFKNTSFSENSVGRKRSDAVNRARLLEKWAGRDVRLPRLRGYLERQASA